MSERPDNDSARDGTLTAIYRATRQDAPSPALDAAILAAARREVGARPRPAGFSFARSWRGPLSAAAVIVLSASLVMVMREEAPDVAAPPRADAPPAQARLEPPPAANETATADERKLLRERPSPERADVKPTYSAVPPGSDTRQLRSDAKPAKDAAAGRAEPGADGPVAIAKRRDALTESVDAGRNRAAAAPEPQRQATTASVAPEFVPTPAAAPPRDAEVAAARPAPAVGAIAGRMENRVAKTENPSADRAGADSPERGQSANSATRQSADVAPAPFQSAPASPAASAVERNTDLAPEKWLERIEELRRQGRLDEARTSLAEFRKRYPDYRLPDSLRDGLKQ